MSILLGMVFFIEIKMNPHLKHIIVKRKRLGY